MAQPGDVFLLCSDGLYVHDSDDNAIAEVLAGGDNLYASAGKLVEAANAAGGRDNVSVVLFCPDGSVDSGIEPAAGRGCRRCRSPQPRSAEGGSGGIGFP